MMEKLPKENSSQIKKAITYRKSQLLISAPPGQPPYFPSLPTFPSLHIPPPFHHLRPPSSDDPLKEIEVQACIQLFD